MGKHAMEYADRIYKARTRWQVVHIINEAVADHEISDSEYGELDMIALTRFCDM